MSGWSIFAASIFALVIVFLGGLALFGFVGSIWLMREEDEAKRAARRSARPVDASGDKR